MPSAGSETESRWDDATTPIARLKRLVSDFVAARRWESYHVPKNLAMALVVEAGELVEIFQWLTPEEALGVTETAQGRTRVEEELADVLCYVLALANALDIDLSASVAAKMVKNTRKYPPVPGLPATGGSREASAAGKDTDSP